MMGEKKSITHFELNLQIIECGLMEEMNPRNRGNCMPEQSQKLIGQQMEKGDHYNCLMMDFR